MTQIKVTIQGLDQFEKAVARAPQETLKELSKAVRKSVLTIQSNALKEAPVNKSYGGGNLRQNIRAAVSGISGTVTSYAPYSIFVHEGTRPHIIVPVNKKVLANKRTGQFFGRLVHHPGTKPNQFFIRAIQRSAQSIEKFFGDALVASLRLLQ